MNEERIVCFEPVAREDARLLILGTMPSVESLKQSFYYSHPRNAFWPIMAEILGADRPESIDEKKELLLTHGIALWDVARSCVRPGSLDSDIRDVEPNDFASLFACCKGIGKILFNGATAKKLYEKWVGMAPEGCIMVQVPSTSPAYTLPYDRKLAAWRKEMEWIL